MRANFWMPAISIIIQINKTALFYNFASTLYLSNLFMLFIDFIFLIVINVTVTKEVNTFLNKLSVSMKL